VAQRAREWLHEQEQRLAARQEPEFSGVPRRGVILLDILVVAAACRMDLDALVAAAKARAPGGGVNTEVLAPERVADLIAPATNGD
jgi:hypothetical protein